MEMLSETVRRYIGIEHGVVFDYFELFENQGFRVIQNAFFFLNSRPNPERQLFRLAYELGKLLILTYAVNRGEQIFKTDDGTTFTGKKPLTAHQAARRFAATFLMPAGAVRETVAQLGIQKKHWSYALLLRVKHRFGISAEAFLYRLDENP